MVEPSLCLLYLGVVSLWQGSMRRFFLLLPCSFDSRGKPLSVIHTCPRCVCVCMVKTCLIVCVRLTYHTCTNTVVYTQAQCMHVYSHGYCINNVSDKHTHLHMESNKTVLEVIKCTYLYFLALLWSNICMCYKSHSGMAPLAHV